MLKLTPLGVQKAEEVGLVRGPRDAVIGVLYAAGSRPLSVEEVIDEVHFATAEKATVVIASLIADELVAETNAD